MDPEPGSELVDEETEAAEVEEAQAEPDPGRGPTPTEEQAAERAGEPDEATGEAYRDMTRKGAEAEGEGRVP